MCVCGGGLTREWEALPLDPLHATVHITYAGACGSCVCADAQPAAHWHHRVQKEHLLLELHRVNPSWSRRWAQAKGSARDQKKRLKFNDYLPTAKAQQPPFHRDGDLHGGIAYRYKIVWVFQIQLRTAVTMKFIVNRTQRTVTHRVDALLYCFCDSLWTTMESSGSRADSACKREALRWSQSAVQQEELPEAQHAARRAQGALRPARAQRADSRGQMQRRSKKKNQKANAARHEMKHTNKAAGKGVRAPHGV